MKKLEFSVNLELIDKIPPIDKRFFAEGFAPLDDSLDKLVQAIQDGWAFSYQFTVQTRRSENSLTSEILIIDIDDHWCISDALKDPINSSYCSLIYTTSGHHSG